jgi:hypothetical protein
MNLREAAQQALEALEYAQSLDIPHFEEHVNALVALRTALAEPVQEPVAWIHEDELPSSYPYDLMFPYSKVNGVRLFPVFGPFPQRKPLTDEEIWRKYQGLWPFHPAAEPKLAADIAAFARAIERAHGIGGEA